MQTNLKLIARKYGDVYRKLYKREPGEIRLLDSDFILVNNVQIRVTELEQMTARLEEEYRTKHQKNKGNILRLINWLRG